MTPVGGGDIHTIVGIQTGNPQNLPHHHTGQDFDAVLMNLGNARILAANNVLTMVGF